MTDFGLAKALESESDLTRTAAVIGTPSYMSPEQARGRTKQLTTSSDVFSSARFSMNCSWASTVSGRDAGRNVAAGDGRGTQEAAIDQPGNRCGPGDDLSQVPAKRPGATLRFRGRFGRRSGALANWGTHSGASEQRLGTDDQMGPAQAGDGSLGGSELCGSRLTGGRGGCIQVQCPAGTGLRASRRRLKHRKGAQRKRAEDALKEADKARDGEQTQRKLAEKSLRKAEAADYLKSIAWVDRDWLVKNVARNERLLDDCPLHVRQWEWSYLKRLCHSDLHTLRAHATNIAAVAFCKDGNSIASVSSDGVLKLWNTEAGKEIASFRVTMEAITSVALGADGALLVVGGKDGSVGLWEVSTGGRS